MINVTKSYLPNLDKYKTYIEQIYHNRRLTNNGHFVKELEERLKDYLKVKNIVLVSNGTLALQLAYRLLNIKGDVLTTPFSFVATTSSIIWEGLNPVFVDIDPKTFNIDYSKIEEKVGQHTSCIVPVHVFGNVCEVEHIKKIAEKYNLKIIYDAAHAFGVKYKDKSILSYGDISILSFHATKIFHTIEGGALIINDDELYEKARLMINFGIKGPESIVQIGINGKMSEFQAAMGLCVLDDIDYVLKRRKQIYQYYIECLSELEGVTFQKINNDSVYNHSYFPVLFDSEKILIKVKQMLEQNDIFPRRYFYPSLNNLPYIRGKYNVPISNNISKRILCLPMYEDLRKEEQDKIIEIIFRVIN